MSTYSTNSQSVQKISLKPVAHELLYKHENDKNSHFDVVSSQGNTQQEKNLGYLFVLGSAQFSEEEDLAYLVNLISSLARREYYGPESLQSQNPKVAFENTLKKLNEVLENFFSNKDLALDIGLAAIANENIYISKIGKFKVGLAREGEYIDVINNLELFNKEKPTEDLQFANIVSGKLQSGDKLFAYIPFRSITSREKQLRTVLTSQEQSVFTEKIQQLSLNAQNFSCCGIHILLQEVKEIPLRSIPQEISSAKQILDTQDDELPKTQLSSATIDDLDENQVFSDIEKPAVAAVFRKEVSRNNRLGLIPKLSFKLKKMDRMISKRFLVLCGVVVTIFLISYLLWQYNGEDRKVFSEANQNITTAEKDILENKLRDARTLLTGTISQLKSIDSNKSKKLQSDIEEIINKIDRTQNADTTQIADVSNEFASSIPESMGVIGNKIVISDNNRKIIFIEGSSIKQSGFLQKNSPFLFEFSEKLIAFDGREHLEFLNLNSGKNDVITLKSSYVSKGAVYFNENLYILTDSGISKVTDIAHGQTTGTVWSTEPSLATALAMTIDGSIFTIDSNGKLSKYFQGKEVASFQLPLSNLELPRLVTNENNTKIYLTFKDAHKVFAINKDDGAIESSYGIPNVANISLDDKILYILTSDKKVLKISL